MKRRKLLLVDACQITRSRVSELCDLLGIDFVYSPSNMAGFKAFLEHRPNITLLDFELPSWNGASLLERIRQVDAKALILILSPSDSQHIYQQAMAEGANDFSVKPVRVFDLLPRINLHLLAYDKFLANDQALNRSYNKGISPNTLELVRGYFAKQSAPHSIHQISKDLGLAYQTVHRYVHHLLLSHEVDVIHEYGSSGRPRNKYIFHQNRTFR